MERRNSERSSSPAGSARKTKATAAGNLLLVQEEHLAEKTASTRWGMGAPVYWLMGANCVCLFPTLQTVTSCWQSEIRHRRRIYNTMEICKHSKPGFFCFFFFFRELFVRRLPAHHSQQWKKVTELRNRIKKEKTSDDIVWAPGSNHPLRQILLDFSFIRLRQIKSDFMTLVITRAPKDATRAGSKSHASCGH